MLERLQLDRAGIREVLQSPEVRQMVNGAVIDIKSRVRARLPPGTQVNHREYTTDRDAASITIADVRGMAWQARDGVLTRAAGEAGIEVRAWGSR
jgi:hypothetical protein